jgi:hypothetical protein
MKLASFEWLYPRCDESFFDQEIAIPHAFIASEAEKMIRDAAAGCRESWIQSEPEVTTNISVDDPTLTPGPR